mgnify:CR=1 FL=1
MENRGRIRRWYNEVNLSFNGWIGFFRKEGINMNDKLEIIKRKAVQIFSEEDLDRKINSDKKLTIKLGRETISKIDLKIIYLFQ